MEINSQQLNKLGKMKDDELERDELRCMAACCLMFVEHLKTMKEDQARMQDLLQRLEDDLNEAE